MLKKNEIVIDLVNKLIFTLKENTKDINPTIVLFSIILFTIENLKTYMEEDEKSYSAEEIIGSLHIIVLYLVKEMKELEEKENSENKDINLNN